MGINYIVMNFIRKVKKKKKKLKHDKWARVSSPNGKVSMPRKLVLLVTFSINA